MKLSRKVRKNGLPLEQRCTGKYHGGGGCGSRFLIMHENAILRTCAVHSVSPFKYYVYVFYTFKCPDCGVQSNIPVRKIHLRLRRKLDKKFFV